MVREASPKRLQREKRFSEALEKFVQKYIESLNEGDRFISAIYLDEVVQTLLLEADAHSDALVGGARSEDSLRYMLSSIRSRVSPNRLHDYEDDVEIAMRKRFPEKYKKYLRETERTVGED